jgi:hypothetical protein
MSIYESLKSFFVWLGQGQPTMRPVSSTIGVPPPVIYTISADRQAYLEKHLAEIEEEATLFAPHYPIDFNDFLYRPAAADFIRREIIPLRNPDGKYNDFLDISHWANRHCTLPGLVSQ